jgi:transposase
MRAYSPDLRERIIAALEAGTDPQSEIAATFGVSLSFVEKLWRKWRKTGNCDALPHAGGRERSLKNDEAKIRAAVAEQPDLTLAELSEQIEAAKGTRVVPMTMCRELKRLNLPRKKSRLMPPNETRRG